MTPLMSSRWTRRKTATVSEHDPFLHGGINGSNKFSTLYVRLVRAGQ